jgi:hypothetical protein
LLLNEDGNDENGSDDSCRRADIIIFVML